MALSRITEAVASFTDLTIGDDLTLSDDLLIASDAAVVKFGADAEVTLTHVHNTGLLLNSTSVIQFNDASQNIGAPSATVLDINATDEIELNATLIDVNGNLDVSGTIVSGGTLTATTSIGIGSAVLTEAELELLDGITAGAGAASKALVLDASADVASGLRNLTASGTLQGTTITATTAFVPDASDGAALGTTSLEFSDLFLADGAVIALGTDQDVTLTHVADTGILLNSTMAIQFNDASQFINAPSATVLDINATDEIELNATLIDVNGNLDVSGTIVGASTLSATTGTFSGILKTDDATEATSTTDGSLQTDGGLSVVKDAVFGDDIKLLSDSAVIHFGADSDITLTHAADTSLATNGVMIATTFEPTGDTAAGDNAAMGYTAAEGLILTGQGSTNDVTIKNDADADVIEIPTGTTNVTVAGNLGVGGTAVANTDTDTSNTGNVTLDFGANQNFVLTLTGNTTLVNPSTEQVGQSGFIVCIQDGTGSRTLSLGTDYETAGGAGITLTSTASATDIIPYVVAAAGRILLGAPQLAFS